MDVCISSIGDRYVQYISVYRYVPLYCNSSLISKKEGAMEFYQFFAQNLVVCLVKHLMWLLAGVVMLSVTGTWTVRYRVVPSKIGRRRPILKAIDRWRLIEEEKGEKKRKRKKKRRGEERIPRQRRPRPTAVAARGSPAAAFSPARGDATRGRRPRPLFLPREETERLPVRDRSRR
ncbi:hypothetical protein BHE74_00027259, partial [Ensete ventricosum]